MPLVTKLEQTKRNSDRYSVYLNDQFAFALTNYIVVKFKIKEGLNLTNSQIEDIVFEENLEYLKTSVLDFISRRPRSEKEVIDNINKKLYGRIAKNLKFLDDGVSEKPVSSNSVEKPVEDGIVSHGISDLADIVKKDLPEQEKDIPFSTKSIQDRLVNEVLSFLKKYDYLDDVKFAQWLAEQRTNQNKGQMYIKQDLFKKGIPKEIVKKVLDNLDTNDALQKSYQLAIKKYKKEPDDYKKKQKTYNYLLRKGFTYDEISTLDI